MSQIYTQHKVINNITSATLMQVGIQHLTRIIEFVNFQNIFLEKKQIMIFNCKLNDYL